MAQAVGVRQGTPFQHRQLNTISRGNCRATPRHAGPRRATVAENQTRLPSRRQQRSAAEWSRSSQTRRVDTAHALQAPGSGLRAPGSGHLTRHQPSPEIVPKLCTPNGASIRGGTRALRTMRGVNLNVGMSFKRFPVDYYVIKLPLLRI